MLQAQQLICRRNDKKLFNGINFQLNAGQVMQISGKNGVGKTTLLSALCGLYQDYSGTIEWQNKPITQELTDFVNALLFIGHKPGINELLSPFENIKWYVQLKQGHFQLQKNTNTVIENALSELGLQNCIYTPCYQLSAGQQRRVALVRLYLSKQFQVHGLWVLDEPFSSLDQEGVIVIENLIQKFTQQGGSVIFSTHQPLKKLICDEEINLNQYSVN